jgi:hypothetical protein
MLYYLQMLTHQAIRYMFVAFFQGHLLCAAVVSFHDITVNTVTLAASHTNVSYVELQMEQR